MSPDTRPAPPGSEEDLQQRLSWVTPSDTVRGMILTGVLEVVRELGDEAAVRQCLEAAGEKRFVDFFSYPCSLQITLIYSAAKLLHARYGSFEKALWSMGHQGAKSFLSSAAGKLLMALAQGNPKRLLDALPSAFSVGGSSLKAQVQWKGSNNAVFILEHDYLPAAYTEGVLEALFETTKAKGFQVRSRHPEPLIGEYDLSWE